MSEQAYMTLHYMTNRRAEANISISERFKTAFAAMKEDFSRTYQTFLDGSADLVIRKLNL